MAEREFGNQVFTMMQYERLKKSDGEPAAENALKKAIKEGKIIIKDVIADAFLQNTLLIPEEYSVIATLNLNGDYISDQLAAMVGGIGIAPGANINYITGHAIFEATHGTAPNIAGKTESTVFTPTIRSNDARIFRLARGRSKYRQRFRKDIPVT